MSYQPLSPSIDGCSFKIEILSNCDVQHVRSFCSVPDSGGPFIPVRTSAQSCFLSSRKLTLVNLCKLLSPRARNRTPRVITRTTRREEERGEKIKGDEEGTGLFKFRVILNETMIPFYGQEIATRNDK